jgi:hypothetical protein
MPEKNLHWRDPAAGGAGVLELTAVHLLFAGSKLHIRREIKSSRPELMDS